MGDSKAVLAETLDRIIRERGLKKGDVADRAGFSNQSELTPYLKGERAASLDILDRLARALGVAPTVLIGGGDHGVEECYRRVGDELRKRRITPWVETPATQNPLPERREVSDAAHPASSEPAAPGADSPKTKRVPKLPRR